MLTILIYSDIIYISLREREREGGGVSSQYSREIPPKTTAITTTPTLPPKKIYYGSFKHKHPSPN